MKLFVVIATPLSAPVATEFVLRKAVVVSLMKLAAASIVMSVITGNPSTPPTDKSACFVGSVLEHIPTASPFTKGTSSTVRMLLSFDKKISVYSVPASSTANPTPALVEPWQRGFCWRRR